MQIKRQNTKYGTKSLLMQDQMSIFCRPVQAAALGIVVIAGAGTIHGQTTSPLEILSNAPKVRFDDPTPTPQPTPQPAYIPSGGGPPVQPVAPYFTPYGGQSVAPPQQPAYGSPQYGSNPNYVPVNPGPTPRPVLGPEDVDRREKKGGFVRGLIRAIPFVGGDDDDEDTPSPSTPPYAPPGIGPTGGSERAGDTIYRGYETPAPLSGDTPLLRAPDDGQARDAFADDAGPASPPIMTPEPRVPIVDENAPVSPSGVDSPLLTIRRESDTTDTESGRDIDGTTDLDTVEPKQPDMSRSPDTELDASVTPVPTPPPTPTPTPRPLEQATSSIIIQDSRDDSLGPRPDTSAINIKPFDPLATPEPTVASDIATSLTIEESDLGMPNPTYEQNAAVLAEFQDGVRMARSEDYEGAARQFRAYAQNHPSSGLAPRAAFLAVIFEKNRIQARENLEDLERKFPESRYVKLAKSRRADLEAAQTDPVISQSRDNETPAQKIDRLEKDLTRSVGDVSKEPALRAELGTVYLQQDEIDRAYEVVRPAVEMSQGTPAEAEVLLAMGRVLAARGETVQALSLYESVDEKNPQLIYKDADSAWSVGLAYERAGRYPRARAIYNEVRQRWPETPQAEWATRRLTELAALHQ